MCVSVCACVCKRESVCVSDRGGQGERARVSVSLGAGIRVSGARSSVGLWVSGVPRAVGVRVSGVPTSVGMRVSGAGCQTPCTSTQRTVFWVPGSGCRVPGYKFLVSGIGVYVQGLEFSQT